MRCQVADFGIAEVMATTMASQGSAAGAGGTSSGGAAGTLQWKAPETFRGRQQ